MIQNAAVRLVFNGPKRAHVTPLFICLHWLPVAARIQFKTLMLAYRTTTGSALPTSTHYYESTSPPEVWDLLVSNTSWYHHREAQNHSPEHSLSPFLAGGMIFPPLSGMLDPCQSSSNNWKLISFNTTWLHPKLKKTKNLSLDLSLLPLLACTYFNNAWDLVLRALPLSVCFFKMNRFMHSPIVRRFGKASAKWLNVNVCARVYTSIRPSPITPQTMFSFNPWLWSISHSYKAGVSCGSPLHRGLILD